MLRYLEYIAGYDTFYIGPYIVYNSLCILKSGSGIMTCDTQEIGSNTLGSITLDIGPGTLNLSILND